MDYFHFQNSGGLELLICEPLNAAGFRHAFTTRSGGVSPLPESALNLGTFTDDPRDNILENRRRLSVALGAASWPLITVRQIHSAIVHRVETPPVSGEEATADALIGHQAEVLLAVQTADCLPILLADRRTGAIAAVHAGWRGTLAGIVARTVEQMQQAFQTQPADLLAAIGPAIGPCCFEVGPEVVSLFSEAWPDTQSLVSPPPSGLSTGKAHFNLGLANRRQLRHAGLADSSIFESRLCTICHNDRFFSYRFELGAERPVGRLMGVIGRSNGVL